MIAVEHIEQRAMQLDKLGVNYICVHTASDAQTQGENPLEELKCLNAVLQKTKLAVAGGITTEMLQHIIPYQLEIVIVGRAITTKQDKRKAAIELKNVMR